MFIGSKNNDVGLHSDGTVYNESVENEG